jgi:hypothetical protein
VLLTFVPGWKTKIKDEIKPDRPIGATTFSDVTTLYD